MDPTTARFPTPPIPGEDTDGSCPAPPRPTLREVFQTEESPLLRYAYGLTGQRESAEDLVQEAFLRLHTHWLEVSTPRAWLFRTVRNLALNHLRDSRPLADLDSQPELPAATPDPEQHLGRMEAIGTLQLLVAELPPADRDLIRLKYHRKFKYEDIARHTGQTAGNIGYRLHHLLKHLADSLRKLGIESAEG